jgi:hypothetical protein
MRTPLVAAAAVCGTLKPGSRPRRFEKGWHVKITLRRRLSYLPGALADSAYRVRWRQWRVQRHAIEPVVTEPASATEPGIGTRTSGTFHDLFDDVIGEQRR